MGIQNRHAPPKKPPKQTPQDTSPKPTVGTRIAVDPKHYFYFDGSDTPALRIRRNKDNTWESMDPGLLTGLILFVTDRKGNLPVDIVVVRVTKTAVMAAELGWR